MRKSLETLQWEVQNENEQFFFDHKKKCAIVGEDPDQYNTDLEQDEYFAEKIGSLMCQTITTKTNKPRQCNLSYQNNSPSTISLIVIIL